MKLCSALTLFLAFCTFASPVTAQMFGTYTIDPNGTGPRNFTDFITPAYQLVV